MTSKILYVACGIGSGGIHKGAALWRAAKRRNLDVEVGFAVATSYPKLIPEGAYVKRLMSSCRMQEAELVAAITEFEPDVVVSCYKLAGLQEALERTGVPGLLMWRKHTDPYLSLGGFKPHVWKKIIATEPGQRQELSGLGVPLVEAPPCLTVWPDELYPAKEARERLLKAWEMVDRNLPIALFVHNGDTSDGVTTIFETLSHQLEGSYHKIMLSQGRNTYPSIDEPIAKYFNAVAVLGACASPGIFWEWKTFAPKQSKSIWLAAPRSDDPQYARGQLLSLPIPEEYANGIDTILDEAMNANSD